jgi:ABC-type multidrug transport system fused ATPase/permease subunit
MKQDIEFENVSFHYPTRPNCMILSGINLRIESGSTVALVGSSGCGKSSMISLLQRFYDPQGGKIKLDGKDIKTLNLKSYREKIGVVGQEPSLFSGTIRSNIACGNPNATLDEVKQAAKMANAHGFIEALPKGYDT